MDIVDKETRSRMMSGIKGKDTKPELLIRKGLHHEGFRYRLHVKTLPGKPDFVLKKYNAVVFINGCFWHKHDCRYFKWPKTREDFWREKLEKNAFNDRKNLELLKSLGWRVCIVWECAIRKEKKDLSPIITLISEWLKSKSGFMEVRD